jgi:hypothetical protein
MRHGVVLWCAAVIGLAAGARADAWLQVAEFAIDPPEKGQQVVTARLTPAHTAEYEQLLFDCAYRQDIPWIDARGKPVIKTIEPVRFTYARKIVKLVADLDFYCSFRVPVGRQELQTAYGERVFSPEAPVRIDRVRISAMQGGTNVWSREFKVPGRHVVGEPPPPPPPGKRAPARAAFGEVDLD